MEKEMKLAVLIDAENISSKYVEIILGEAAALGNVIYKRIYGNWTTPQMGSWKDVILENAIQPVQQYNNASGKNASDSSLIIDAMDLLFLNKLDGFVIVSSDSDFTRLAARLRESEMFVLGMGVQNTPRSFISACSKFAYLDVLYAAEHDKKAEKAPQKPEKTEHAAQKPGKAEKPRPASGINKKTIQRALREFALEKSDDDGWISAGQLASLLDRKYPDFDVRNFGYKKLYLFVESLGLFYLRRDEQDPSKLFFKLRQP